MTQEQAERLIRAVFDVANELRDLKELAIRVLTERGETDH